MFEFSTFQELAYIVCRYSDDIELLIRWVIYFFGEGKLNKIEKLIAHVQRGYILVLSFIEVI